MQIISECMANNIRLKLQPTMRRIDGHSSSEQQKETRTSAQARVCVRSNRAYVAICTVRAPQTVHRTPHGALRESAAEPLHFPLRAIVKIYAI
ncbi:hypothetical protein EVAR_43514_1 [Eumeta japonica]|uniref:Uncharacterized protein n=1 Tax=Eumeta variegata TaxID=151549 RepID=A0A4C1YHP4_EUMVA|nr:hypothetical protein EVAR_43514_1 [Eumeta japonica]